MIVKIKEDFYVNSGDATLGDLVSEMNRVYGNKEWMKLKLEDVIVLSKTHTVNVGKDSYTNTKYINNTNTTNEPKKFDRVFIQS